MVTLPRGQGLPNSPVSNPEIPGLGRVVRSPRDSHKGKDSDNGHCDEQLDRDDGVDLEHRWAGAQVTSSHPKCWPLPRKQPAQDQGA
jgi:hypothetical protein